MVHEEKLAKIGIRLCHQKTGISRISQSLSQMVCDIGLMMGTDDYYPLTNVCRIWGAPFEQSLCPWEDLGDSKFCSVTGTLSIRVEMRLGNCGRARCESCR